MSRSIDDGVVACFENPSSKASQRCRIVANKSPTNPALLGRVVVLCLSATRVQMQPRRALDWVKIGSKASMGQVDWADRIDLIGLTDLDRSTSVADTALTVPVADTGHTHTH